MFPTDLADLFTNGSLSSRSDIAQIGELNDPSAREMKILCCLLDGAQNKQIARQLDIADATVKVHLKAILKKIHVDNRIQAAIWAKKHNMKCGPSDKIEHKVA